MLLLPLGAIFVMLRNNERKQPVEVATVDILPGETKATLILADGKSMVLQHDTVRDIVVSEGVNAKNSVVESCILRMGIRGKICNIMCYKRRGEGIPDYLG